MKKQRTYFLASLFFICSCVSVTKQDEDAFSYLFNQGDFKEASGVYGNISDLSFLQTLNTATAAMISDEGTKAGIGFARAESLAKENNTDGYDVKYYEQIMLETYSAINAWNMNKPNDVRMYFNRAHQAQAQAINDNKAQISKLEKETSAANLSSSVAKAKLEAGKLYSPFSNLKAYKDFANPYTTYLAGLFLTLNSASSSDIENGLNYLKRANAMMPNNKFVAEDITFANAKAEGKMVQSRVWVLYEAGLAQGIDKQTVNIPIYYGTGLRILTLSLPMISETGESMPNLLINTSDSRQPLSPQLIADMNSIVSTELNERMPREVAKAILWMIANLAVQEGVNQAFKGSDVEFIGPVAGLLASQITNPIETRTWKSLPGQMLIAGFPMPKDHKVKLSLKNSDVKLPIITFNKSAKYAIIHLRMPTPSSYLGITVSEFN